MSKNKFNCIIIGGGVTGAGIARDLSLRGLSILLLEKQDLSEGTTGRCHAMLHSGGRYVFKDPIAARECAEESKILLKIAPHISELCGGYFIGSSEEEIEYGNIFQQKCKVSGVWTEEFNVQTLLKEEPNCNPNTKRVFKVNDGYIDPFLLTIYNAYDAKLHGAEIKTYHRVISLILDESNGKNEKNIIGVDCIDILKNSRIKFYADIVINATGPWASFLEKDLKLQSPLKIAPTMGTLLVIKDRIVNHLINRLRKPGDGDIFVPSHNSVILGTTSKLVDYNQLDKLMTDKKEIEYILSLGEHLIPSIRKHRVIRFYSGARPLISSGGPLREVSRKFDIIDYEKTDGYSGFLTITGGKLTTYRLMAEQISNIICNKLGIKEKCNTSELSLPGGDKKVPMKVFENLLHVDSKTAFDMQFKWGTFYKEFNINCTDCLDSYNQRGAPKTICECEHVTDPELLWVQKNLDVKEDLDTIKESCIHLIILLMLIDYSIYQL